LSRGNKLLGKVEKKINGFLNYLFFFFFFFEFENSSLFYNFRQVLFSLEDEPASVFQIYCFFTPPSLWGMFW
jgi:hypothetical protein